LVPSLSGLHALRVEFPINNSLKHSIFKHYNGQESTGTNASAPVLEPVDRFKGTWSEHIDLAKSTWQLLSERELRSSEGRPQNLAWLIQGRYTMSPRDASAYVEQFIQKCGY
jgi:hypothetical protein